MWNATLTLSPEIRFIFQPLAKFGDNNHSVSIARIENALLNFLYSCMQEQKQGLAKIVEETLLKET